MRGKSSAATGVYESPYATTILPGKDNGRAAKPADAPAYAPSHVAGPTHPPAPEAAPAHPAAPEAAPAYPPPAAAPAYPPPAAAPAYPPPAAAPACPPPAAAEYPVHYPTAPGFPPQPHYADTAHVADPALSAPAAAAAPAPPVLPAAPIGYPSASYQPPSYQPAPYQPAAYQPAAYPPPTNPPSGYQPNRFEPQGFAAPGYAAPGYQPPGYQPPGQAQPYQSFPPTGGSSTGAKVLIGVLIGLVVLGILAAIPVFLSQHQKPANRNIVLPSVLLDQQRLSSADLDASVAAEVASLQKHTPGGSQAQAAFYGQDGLPTFLVVAGKPGERPTPADVKAFFSTQSGGELTFTPVGNGPFGGTMECGPATANGIAATICGSIDDAGVVFVLGFNTTPSQLAIVTREILGVIEQKG
jgi:hypothetical protein